MKITPSWVGTFESNLQTLLQDGWARANQGLIWDKVMTQKQSGTLRELYFWLLESANISDEGQGGNKRFDDIAALYYEIDNKNSGAGLRLTKNEIEDNMMRSPKGMPALDYAANWAKQMGGAAAYWPEQKLFDLIKDGKNANAYDGKKFFATDHPINPYNVGGGNYSNLISAKPIDATNATDIADATTNFASAIASIAGLVQPNGAPRKLKVTKALFAPSEQKRASEVLSAKFFGASGATENVVANYGIEPIVCPQLTEAGVYYLCVEELANESGAFVFQSRDPYVLSTYTPDTQAELQRRKEFEWSFDGRNAAAYGHPYLCFRVEPT